MKSKRLKNFCQVCRKQCKDENGYHCHLNSGHHQKRLRQLATNPQQHIQKYSNELQNRIVQILKTKYPGIPKDIQDIYQQYAQDKHHIKFTFTKWKDLSQFAQHLKSVRNLKVQGKPPYTKITYVVNKAGDFIRQKKEEEAVGRKEREKEMEGRKLEERIARMREVQAERYREMKEKLSKEDGEGDGEQEFDLDNQVFRFDFAEKTYQPSKLFLNQPQQIVKPEAEAQSSKNKISNIDRLLTQIQNKDTKNKFKSTSKSQDVQQQEQQQFEWIMPGIVVKVLPHEIPAVFHHKKATINSIKEPYIAELKLGNAVLSIDQANLQTVIPKTGHEVMVLKGELRGRRGLLREVDVQGGIGKVEVSGGSGGLVGLPFNQFSKTS